MRNCSRKHLPNITAQCNDKLNDVFTSYEEFLEGVQECFYYYVEENDIDGHVQRDVKQLMKANHEDNTFDWSIFTIGTSCAIESLLPDGKYDEKANDTCVQCFVPLFNADEDDSEIVRNCSTTHLPNMADLCSAELELESSFDLFWEGVQKCFYYYVKENDLDGKIQSDVKKLMTEEKGRNILIPVPGSQASQFTLSISQKWSQEPEGYQRFVLNLNIEHHSELK